MSRSSSNLCLRCVSVWFVCGFLYQALSETHMYTHTRTHADIWSPFAYDAVYAVARGLSALRSSGAAVSGEALLRSMTPFFGVSGEINTDEVRGRVGCH